MVRLVALFVAVVFVSASPAFAQSFKSTSPQSQPPVTKIDFSARAAGLDSIPSAADRHAIKPLARTTPSAQSTTKRSVWKSPWPYVIIAAAAATVYFIAYRDGYTPLSGY